MFETFRRRLILLGERTKLKYESHVKAKRGLQMGLNRQSDNIVNNASISNWIELIWLFVH